MAKKRSTAPALVPKYGGQEEKIKAVEKIARSTPSSLEIYKLTRQGGLKQCRFLISYDSIDL